MSWRKVTEDATNKIKGNKSLMIFLILVVVVVVISWLG